METLYLVFKDVNHPHKVAFQLRGVYTQSQYYRFAECLRQEAERNAVNKLCGQGANMPHIPKKPQCPPDIEKTLKAMKKESNQYRLAGDFESFISINAKIRTMNQLLKEKKAYEADVAQHKAIKQKALVYTSRYEEIVQAELRALASKILVIVCEVAPRDDNYLTINLYRDYWGPHLLEMVTFNTEKSLDDYPSYVSKMQFIARETERFEERIRGAHKHYKTCRAMLTDCQAEAGTPKFKKAFKRATDAYYNHEKLVRELDDFNQRSANICARIRDVYHSHCQTVRVPIDAQSNCDTLFSFGEVRKFGTRVLLPIN